MCKLESFFFSGQSMGLLDLMVSEFVFLLILSEKNKFNSY